MNQSYSFLKALLTALCLSLPFLSFGVTQKEMEQARTIAAKAYIRWVNDGSGYLDDQNPKTMEELEAILKPKEQENIKAFKAIPVPSDYTAWDKDKLIEYWAVTAFQNPGLQEKGRGGRLRARSQISKMTVSAPQSQSDQQPSSPGAVQSSPIPEPSGASTENNGVNENKELKAEENAILESDPFDDELEVDQASNYTWVYIMILAILVAIVVALVVYAANVFKKNGSSKPNTLQGNFEDKQRYESRIADKDSEITLLNKKLEAATRQNSELKAKVESLTAELTSLKGTSRGAAVSPEKESSPAAQRPKGSLRSIYLGRANTKGMFVRADRTLNPGHSVYLLDTGDGRTGTFRVADSPAAWSLALSNPKEYLETASVAQNPEEAPYASRISTETPGTAMFEDGCWRVVRKARIRFQD